eukprot:CAMPEP_0195103854 /NCGR_PEP_ID=MMETSP0448-20130528/72756_1 /TAXON_ID=66468 /ORGANISM="Heterocapsa triquestra, Strain CCMP 448" /LENGTH=104 /DNA_ID=CAMNT_0040139603 /DNA_START=191 /DNA_END=503 /DNA_ORIENTATION=+
MRSSTSAARFAPRRRGGFDLALDRAPRRRGRGQPTSSHPQAACAGVDIPVPAGCERQPWGCAMPPLAMPAALAGRAFRRTWNRDDAAKNAAAQSPGDHAECRVA